MFYMISLSEDDAYYFVLAAVDPPTLWLNMMSSACHLSAAY